MALRAQALDEEASRLIPLVGVFASGLPLLHAANLPPALHGAHDRPGIPPELLGALLVGLPRGLKLGRKIGVILDERGGDVVVLVAIHRAFAQAILSRNLTERLSGYEPVINSLSGGMSANGAQAWHQCLSAPILIKFSLNFHMLIVPHSCGNWDTPKRDTRLPNRGPETR